jgi:hypothetical protein
MKLTVTTLTNRFARHCVRSIGALLLITTIWQGISLGIDTAVAAPVFVATTAAELIERGTDKVDRGIDSAKSAVKDRDRAANNMPIDRSANTNMDDTKKAIPRDTDTAKIHSDVDADQSERYSGDTPAKVRATADRNSKQAEDFSKKTTEKAKNFFGF